MHIFYALLLLLFPPQQADIHKIIDGDTIDVDSGRIRILGINAPEKGERCWKEAKNAIQLETIVLERDFVNKDKYGRFLRWTQNAELEKQLVNNGFAKTYCIFPNLRYCNELWELQVNAMENHKGCLWNESKSCFKIIDVSKEGEWVKIQNQCNSTRNFKREFVQSDGRQKEILHGQLCPYCNYTISIHLGKFALLFDSKGLIDYEVT